MSRLAALQQQICTLGPDVDGRVAWPQALALAAAVDVTDLHVEPTVDGARIRARHHGELHELGTWSVGVRDRMVMSLKNLSGMTAYVHSRPQDGRVQIEGFSARAATLPVLHGEKVTIRLLAPVTKIRPLEDLGLGDVPELLRIIRERPGMTICVGPAGSGKSTTLYATLLRIYEMQGGQMSVATIEDPVEYEVPWFNQTPVNPEKGLSFATGLRSIVRHDPNAILVGEIRDRETACTAFQAALSGHLVMSTLHGTDSISALYRLLDLGVEPDVLSGALCAVIAQRLVTRLCPHCHGSQCVSCDGRGTDGRVGIFEVLHMSDEVAEGLRMRLPPTELRRRLPSFIDLHRALETSKAQREAAPDATL